MEKSRRECSIFDTFLDVAALIYTIKRLYLSCNHLELFTEQKAKKFNVTTFKNAWQICVPK